MIKEIRTINVSPVFDKNVLTQKQYVINEGGRRSSKSWSIAQVFVKRFTEQRNKRFMICRKTLPALKLSAYQLVLDLLKYYNYYRFVKHNKSDRTIILEELNNYLYFGSLDDPDKSKSTEWNYIWMMEAKEFSYEDFMILDPSLSGKTIPGEINQVFMDFNPDDVPEWIDTFIDKNSENVEVIKSSYKDNPFLEDSYIKKLEDLKNIDDYYYRVFTLGERAKLRGKIYNKIEVLANKDWPRLEEFEDSCYGGDWGFSPDPNVLLFVGLKDNYIYVREVVYENGLTVPNFAIQCERVIEEKQLLTHGVFYFDPSAPGSKQIFSDAGFVMAQEVDNSVPEGIKAIQSYNGICVHEDSKKAFSELKNYKNKQDRSGNVLPIPVKKDDHCPDALRYAVYNRWGFFRDLLSIPKLEYTTVTKRRDVRGVL